MNFCRFISVILDLQTYGWELTSENVDILSLDKKYCDFLYIMAALTLSFCNFSYHPLNFYSETIMEIFGLLNFSLCGKLGYERGLSSGKCGFALRPKKTHHTRVGLKKLARKDLNNIQIISRNQIMQHVIQNSLTSFLFICLMYYDAICT